MGGDEHTWAAMTARRRFRLTVDPIACDGHGICADLLPEWIALDDWGYPILPDGDLPAGLEGWARQAVRDCPVLALELRRTGRGPGSGR